MKKILFVTTMLTIFCGSAIADIKIISPSESNKPLPGIGWVLISENDRYGFSCEDSMQENQNLATFVTVDASAGPVKITGINISCDGVKGLTHEHVKLGQSSQTCTISCAPNNTNSMYWVADDPSKQSSGLYFRKFVNQ